MIHRLNKTSDMIGASKRVLVCRTARKIENNSVLVTNLFGWLKRLAN